MSDLSRRGWQAYEADAALRRWCEAALPAAERALDVATDWRCGGTWWPGVDALPNAADGAVGGVPLDGAAVRASGWSGPWHRAQVSGCLPGYPRRGPDESDVQHRFRVRRDAAHLDGLLPIGVGQRRMLREPHAFVLGIGLTNLDRDAAPLVVWDGSHRILGAAIGQCLRQHDPAHWAQVDLTEIYQATRRAVFETCPRVEIPLAAGGAVLLHRHLLHGIAPWRSARTAPRLTAYFRPLLDDITDWAF